MKRFFAIISLALLLCSVSLQATPITPGQAMDIAKKIFAAQPATKAGSGALKLVWDGEDVATKAAQPAFYVIARDGGGFVIVAGDDNVTPILAISDRNEFKVEEMPANVKWWMKRMKASIRECKEQLPAVREQWSTFLGTKATAAVTPTEVLVYHQTPEWDQGNADISRYNFGRHIFNSKCPLDGTDYSVTGCVAAALGEVLTYQSGQAGVTMPGSSHGSIYYTVGSGYVSASSDSEHPYTFGASYDWEHLRGLRTIEDIKAVVDANTTAGNALLDNLGQLLADLGAMVQASYSKSETSAYTNYATRALGMYLDFNKAAYMDKRSNYSSDQQWIDKLIGEINRRPIVFSGQDASSGNHGGHAFVFDGFGKLSSEHVFHVNFGWGGSCNGYYRITNLDTDGHGNFVNDCGAIIDLYPDTGHQSNSISFVNFSLVPGLSMSDSYPYTAPGNQFMISYALFNSGSDYCGKFIAKLIDRSGNAKADIDIYYHIDADPSLTWTDDIDIAFNQTIRGALLLTIPSGTSIAFGDRIVLYCSTNTSEPIECRKDGSAIDELPLMPAAFIKTDPPYNTGTNSSFKFMLMNNDFAYQGTIWTITHGNTTVQLPQSALEYKFPESGTYKIEAAVAKTLGGEVVENLVTYIEVN